MSFLYLEIKVGYGVFVYKLFDKRDTLSFFIVPNRHMWSNIPIPFKVLYGSMFLELIRLARCIIRVNDFIPRASDTFSRITTQRAKRATPTKQLKKDFLSSLPNYFPKIWWNSWGNITIMKNTEEWRNIKQYLKSYRDSLNWILNVLYQNLYIKSANNFNYHNHLNTFYFNYLVLYFYIHIFMNLPKNIIFFNNKVLLVRFAIFFITNINIFDSICKTWKIMFYELIVTIILDMP